MTFLDKLRGKSWLRWLGYTSFFNLVFYGALYLTFPYEPLRDRIVAEARDRMGLNLRIGKVRLAGVSGIKLSDVELLTSGTSSSLSSAELARRAASSEEEGEEAPPIPPPAGQLHVSSITAKANLLAAIRGKQAFSFSVDAWGGRVRGSVAQGKESRAIRIDARDIDLERSPVQHYAGLDLEGTLKRFSLDLDSKGTDFTNAEGAIELHGEGLLLRGGEVQQFELPAVALGDLDGKIGIKEGRAETEVFELVGPDIEANLELSVRLAAQVATSTLTGKLRLKPSDDWWERNELLKTAADFALPAEGDGWRALNLHGQLQKPGFRP